MHRTDICQITNCTLLKIDFKFVWKFTANFQTEWWLLFIKHYDYNYRHVFIKSRSTFFLMSKEVSIPLMETQLYQLFPFLSEVSSLVTRVFRERPPFQFGPRVLEQGILEFYEEGSFCNVSGSVLP